MRDNTDDETFLDERVGRLKTIAARRARLSRLPEELDQYESRTLFQLGYVMRELSASAAARIGAPVEDRQSVGWIEVIVARYEPAVMRYLLPLIGPERLDAARRDCLDGVRCAIIAEVMDDDEDCEGDEDDDE